MKELNIDEIYSPITRTNNIRLVEEINYENIIDKYWENFVIDVSDYFSGVSGIKKIKCLDSGYDFFYPFNLEGDSKFYQALQRNPYYYLPWKWEYEHVFDKINAGSTVLEFGCGQGFFLEKLESKNIQCCGLEKNQTIARECRNRGLKVFENGEDLLKDGENGRYDIVCSFQVLEHVSDVKSFLENMISFLSEGGSLFISVPNNESFIKYDLDNILNLPPHHMGLWKKESLENLEKFFNIVLVRLDYEPLPSNHIRYYYNVIFGKRFLKYGIIGKIINKILILPTCLIIYIFRKKIIGTTIIAEYKKKKDE